MRLNTLAPSTITTLKEMTKKFLAKYFPLANIVKLTNNINTFTQ